MNPERRARYEKKYMPYEELREKEEELKQGAMKQFAYNWPKWKEVTIPTSDIKFGEETETMVIQFDHENKRAPLFTTAMELFDEKIGPKTASGEAPFTMYHEYVPYQIEFIP